MSEETPDPMGLTDSELVTLVGGPLDGHELDAHPSQDHLVPFPHHYREHGLEPGTDRYIRRDRITFVHQPRP